MYDLLSDFIQDSFFPQAEPSLAALRADRERAMAELEVIRRQVEANRERAVTKLEDVEKRLAAAEEEEAVAQAAVEAARTQAEPMHPMQSPQPMQPNLCLSFFF